MPLLNALSFRVVVLNIIPGVKFSLSSEENPMFLLCFFHGETRRRRIDVFGPSIFFSPVALLLLLLLIFSWLNVNISTCINELCRYPQTHKILYQLYGEPLCKTRWQDSFLTVRLTFLKQQAQCKQRCKKKECNGRVNLNIKDLIRIIWESTVDQYYLHSSISSRKCEGGKRVRWSLGECFGLRGAS